MPYIELREPTGWPIKPRSNVLIVTTSDIPATWARAAIDSLHDMNKTFIAHSEIFPEHYYLAKCGFDIRVAILPSTVEGGGLIQEPSIIENDFSWADVVLFPSPESYVAPGHSIGFGQRGMFPIIFSTLFGKPFKPNFCVAHAAAFTPFGYLLGEMLELPYSSVYNFVPQEVMHCLGIRHIHDDDCYCEGNCPNCCLRLHDTMNTCAAIQHFPGVPAPLHCATNLDTLAAAEVFGPLFGRPSTATEVSVPLNDYWRWNLRDDCEKILLSNF